MEDPSKHNLYVLWTRKKGGQWEIRYTAGLQWKVLKEAKFWQKRAECIIAEIPSDPTAITETKTMKYVDCPGCLC